MSDNQILDERPDTHPGSEDTERVDDEFRAVLEGLRTTLPGVQVLFAFLLTLPFQAPFAELATGEKYLFMAAFLGSAVSSILLIAPSAHQRVRAPVSGVRRHSERHLAYAVRMTIAGTITFTAALTAAVYLVAIVVAGSVLAALTVSAIAALALWAWFYVPLVTFSRL